MIKNVCGIIGDVSLTIFGIAFTVYLFLFPVIGTIATMKVLLSWLREKGWDSNEQLVPVLCAICVQSYLSFAAIEFLIKHY